MAKRYRSLRKGQRLMGGQVIFTDHFFPQIGEPPCDDQEIVEFLESRPGFGSLFWIHLDDEKLPVVNPESIPEGVSAEGLSAAMSKLQEMGIPVNPAYLDGAESPEETPDPSEGEPVVNTLPTLTFVAKANKAALVDIVQAQAWEDVNHEGTVTYLRDAVREKVREAQQSQ